MLYDIAKDFQPSFAAMIALTAAVFAYRAAMAKVQFDREVREKDRQDQRLALLIKLSSGAERPKRALSVVVDKKANHSLETIFIGIPRPPDEFEEAWGKLALVPSAVMQDLEHARFLIRMCRERAENYKFDGILPDTIARSRVVFLENLTEVHGSCERIVASLKPEIDTWSSSHRA